MEKINLISDNEKAQLHKSSWAFLLDLSIFLFPTIHRF